MEAEAHKSWNKMKGRMPSFFAFVIFFTPVTPSLRMKTSLDLLYKENKD
jgi:hypothetical protein